MTVVRGSQGRFLTISVQNMSEATAQGPRELIRVSVRYSPRGSLHELKLDPDEAAQLAQAFIGACRRFLG